MFHYLKLRTKLLIVLVVMSSVPFLLIGIMSITTSNTAVSDLAFGQLESLREVKKTHIERFFVERERNIGSLLKTVTFFEQAAFEKMQSVQEVKKAQVEETVQKWGDDINILSTTSSLQSMGNFEMLLDGQGGVKLATLDMYEKQYLGDSLKQFVQKYQYADVLLITERGNIVYTVNRGLDLGQNVLTGPLQSTPLAVSFQRGMQGVAVQDFAPYPTTADPNAAFIAAPVVSALLKKPIGVVVLKMDNQVLNTIVQRREGMGVTGETFLVGQVDGATRLRSDQVVRKGKINDDVADREIDRMLSGGSGTAVRIGPTGAMEITRYDPLNLPGLNWGIVTTIDLEEAITPALEKEEDDYFTRFTQQYSYTDLLLIHPSGTVFYTVAHRADYETNVADGPYDATGLGQVFRKTMMSKTFSFSDVQAYAPFDGKPVAFMAQPIIKNDLVELIVAVQVPIDEMNMIMQERSGMGTTGETYLVGVDRLLRSDSYIDPQRYSVTASFANPEIGRVDTHASREALAGKTGKAITLNYLGKPVLSAYTPLTLWDTRWALIAEMGTDEALASVHHLSRLIYIGAFGVFVVIVGVSVLVSGYMTKPIKQVVQLARQVSEGDLSVALPTQRIRQDEIGILLRAFHNVITYFREMAAIAANVAKGDLRQKIVPKSDRDTLGYALQDMTTYLQEMAAVATAFAEGDLRQQVTPRSGHDILGKAFDSMDAIRYMIRQLMMGVRQLEESASHLISISAEMASDSEETSHQVQAVSGNSQQINQSISSVSSAAEEFAASARGISQNITDVAKQIAVAVETTNTASATMTRLEQHSAEIGDIIKVITNITQQTNLLALNATIEAARAGEVGRGFVVVANEVKELAKETAHSTENITQRIDAIQSSIQEARTTMKRVAEVIHHIHTLSQIITTSIDQQTSTTDEISQNILGIARGSAEITQAIAEVTDAAQHTSEHAGSVQNAAQQLATLAQQLREIVEQFKI